MIEGCATLASASRISFVKVKKTIKQTEYVNYTCLIVDDDEALREFVKLALSRLGFVRVDTANSGDEGVEQILNNPIQYDIVITDVVMSEQMSGIEMINALNSANVYRLPVILTSGYSSWANQFSSTISSTPFKGASIRAFLRKPFSIDQLTATISKILLQAPEVTESNHSEYYEQIEQ